MLCNVKKNGKCVGQADLSLYAYDMHVDSISLDETFADAEGLKTVADFELWLKSRALKGTGPQFDETVKQKLDLHSSLLGRMDGAEYLAAALEYWDAGDGIYVSPVEDQVLYFLYTNPEFDRMYLLKAKDTNT